MTEQRPPGRPRVGDPADGPSAQTRIRLAAGQGALIDATAAHLAMSGSGLVRRAVRELADGTIKPPKRGDLVPAAGELTDRRTVILPSAQVEKIVAAGQTIESKRPGALLRGKGRAGAQDSQVRDALIRWALDRVVEAELAAAGRDD